MPITMPVPRSTRRSSTRRTRRRTTRTSSRPARTWSRTTRDGQQTGYEPGKSIDLVRNPNWDKSTDYRPAYLDEINRRRTTTDASASRRALHGLAPGARRQPAAGAVLKQAVHAKKDQFIIVPGGGYALLPAEHDDQAAGQHQRPQGDHRRVRPQRRRARRAAASSPATSRPLPPARHPGLRGGRRHEAGTGLDFLNNPRGDRRWPRSTWPQEGPATDRPIGKYTGNDELLTIATNADPGKRPAEVARAQLEKLGLQDQLPHRPAGHAVHEVLPGAQARRSRSARTSGWFKDFTDPQSMLERRSRARTSSSSGNNNSPSSTTRRSTPRWTRPRRARRAPPASRRGRISTSMITEQAPAVPFDLGQDDPRSGRRTSTAWATGTTRR